MSSSSVKPKAVSKSRRKTGKTAKKRSPQRPRRHLRVTSVPRSLSSLTPIHTWLASLKRSDDWTDVKAKRLPPVRTSDNVSQRVSDVIVAPSDVSAASPFVSLNTVYRFRLGGHSVLAQTSGVINTFYSCDPSSNGVNFGEWATLSALFSEFRLVRFGLQLTANKFNTSSTNITEAPMAVAGNLGTAVNPGSYAALADNADCRLWCRGRDTSPTGYHHSLNGTGIEWSQVTTPTVEPFAGAPGSIQVYSNGGSDTETNAVHVMVWAIYEFRSRV